MIDNATYYSQTENLMDRSIKTGDSYKYMKYAVWAYFLLLIFEGALRRWIFPELAAPLLIIRDPIAIWILVKAIQNRIFPNNIYSNGMIIIGVFGLILALLIGHGSLPVALFGARIVIIHFPLMFIIGKIFDRNDVLKMGKAILWIMLPMTLLIIVQFYSPQYAWVNRGVGGDMKGAGFSGALGYFRPPGTFSFILGTSAFYGLANCYVIYYLFHPKEINKVLLLASCVCIIASIPFSVSRSLFFQICITIIFTAIASSRSTKYMGRMILATIVVTVFIVLLSQLSLFQTGVQVLLKRFENAGASEGGIEGTLADRFLGGMLRAITDSGDLPFFGYGIGMGTNVGAVLLSGKRDFLIAEVEWGRVIGEQGILFGLCMITIRFAISAKLLLSSYLSIRKGNLLSWLLISAGLLRILQSQWSQPTALGFSTLMGGLVLASLKMPVNLNLDLDTEEEI